MKRRITTSLLVVMLIVGVVLLFIQPIEYLVIRHFGDKLSIANYAIEDIEKNAQKDTSFDFEEVQTLSIVDVLKAQSELKHMPVIGGIAIPSVEMQLPIIKGVQNSALAVGAGTMKENQQLGVGNYALAGHYFDGKDILFGSLYKVNIGDSIYLTDLQQIYEYQISTINVIEATDVYIIEDIPDKSILTLITCAEKGMKRLSVQADFLNSYDLYDAPEKFQSAFPEK